MTEENLFGGFCARKNGLYGFFRFSGPTIYGVYPVFGGLRGSANFGHSGSSHCSRAVGNIGQSGRFVYKTTTSMKIHLRPFRKMLLSSTLEFRSLGSATVLLFVLTEQ